MADEKEEGAVERIDDETAGAVPVGAGAGEDPGGPGGMGGVHGGVANPQHRPNGGVSPLRSGEAEESE